tara:strand:+ start:255 stop:647 length:393 start_codon:yes stop_codon:yes gene_type:complete
MPEISSFKDLSITFKKHPVTDDLVTVKNNAAISQAIKNLLLTNRGERPFQPQIGSGIHDLLFEPLDYGTASMIKSEITATLSQFEPRIDILNILCYINDADNGFDIELQYAIKGRDDRPVAVEFFLERTR